MISKQQVRQIHRDVDSWRKVGRILNIPARTAWRYANDPDYEPKRADLREAFGLDDTEQVDFIRQVRRSDGTFK